MRNLVGRLMARSDEELRRIAIAWMIPSTARDKAALIAQLMRAMTDLRSTRDFWASRSQDEREMILLFLASGSDQGLTMAELAAELNVAEEQARATAARLYQSGALATNGQESLGIGELPRLFLPRELGQLFARIQDELEAGDISSTTPAALLELLDDTDIQRAAELWGLESMPGLRTRRELTEGLLELSGYPDRRAAVERKLGWDAKRILEKVTEIPAGQTTLLADLADTVELIPRNPARRERLRNALTELEEALLVWHTTLPDGNRALFSQSGGPSPMNRPGIDRVHRLRSTLPPPEIRQPVIDLRSPGIY
ncbi:MAG: hypothetical protein M9947_05770 [Thermomicrobiales bacterium]|nr:hypothetical protein [Thermomicrobiales bacterium]